MNKELIKAIFVRALKTFCQTFGGFITVGLALNEIDWLRALSVSVVAFVYSVVTNLGGVPEVDDVQ